MWSLNLCLNVTSLAEPLHFNTQERRIVFHTQDKDGSNDQIICKMMEKYYFNCSLGSDEMMPGNVE